MNTLATQATELTRAELAGFLFFAVALFVFGCCVFANPKPPQKP
jgi:hypothetical protein